MAVKALSFWFVPIFRSAGFATGPMACSIALRSPEFSAASIFSLGLLMVSSVLPIFSYQFLLRSCASLFTFFLFFLFFLVVGGLFLQIRRLVLVL